MLSKAKHLGIEQEVSLATGPQIAGRFQSASQILRLRLRMTAKEAVNLNAEVLAEVLFHLSIANITNTHAKHIANVIKTPTHD